MCAGSLRTGIPPHDVAAVGIGRNSGKVVLPMDESHRLSQGIIIALCAANGAMILHFEILEEWKMCAESYFGVVVTD